MTDQEREARKQKRLGKTYIYPWIGVDLDKTLAEYHDYVSHTHIGKPIPKMVERVKKFLDDQIAVKIFTARVADPDPTKRLEIIEAIDTWCTEVFGRTLPVTCIKDYGMVRLYDDRAIQVEPNTGELIEEQLAELRALTDN